MKMGKRKALIGITILFCSFIFGTVGVQAKPKNMTEFTCDDISWTISTIEKAWFPDGRMHLRGVAHHATLTGDFNGDLYFMGNNNLDAATIDGTGWGTLWFVGTGVDEGKYFEGIMTLKISDYYISAKFNCHGSGLLDGMHIKGTSAGYLVTGQYSFSGYMH